MFRHHSHALCIHYYLLPSFISTLFYLFIIFLPLTNKLLVVQTPNRSDDFFISLFLQHHLTYNIDIAVRQKKDVLL